MAEYEIKRGHFKTLEGDGLRKLMEEMFGEVNERDDDLVASFGACKEVRARILDKTKMIVESEMDRSVSSEVAMQTIRVWNDFLERVTGFNAKQRSQRAQKAAKKADAEA